MSRDKLIILGVVVLGVLGGLVYRQAKQDAALGTASTEAATEFPTLNVPDDIDKLSIKNGEKPEIVLEKVADPTGTPDDAGPAMKWVLTKPLKAEANQQTVKDIVANLKLLKPEAKVNLKLDDEVRKDKQLDAAHAVQIVAYKGGEKKIDESFGKSGTGGQLVITADKPDTVWTAKGYSSYLYTKEIKDFRKKDMLHFDDANTTQVTLANPHGTFSFTKGDGSDGKWTGTLNGKAIARFDPDKVKDLLKAIKVLNADDFGDGKSLAETGLDKPEITLTVHTKDDEKVPEILVGGPSTGTNHWAKRSDDDQIYQITSYTTDWLGADSVKFEHASDAGAPDTGKKK